MKKISRRTLIKNIGIMGMAPLADSWLHTNEQILRRPIPSSGALLPVVGVGTWQTFDVSDASPERASLKEVLKILLEKGGSVVDSSPMYGRSEEVVGDLSTELNINDRLFIATKVWTTGRDSGIRQMDQSFALMRRKMIELMQIHNLTDWQTHIRTLRAWKEQGKIKYIGITHYTSSAHDRMISILEKEPLDFIQINYNLIDRHAEERLLPFALDKGVAVLINQPFESGSLFRHVRGRQLPAWANDFDCASWAQLFLKFILSHPAVTCVIPGTAAPNHMIDNMGAGFGRLPDASQRKQFTTLLTR